MKKVNRIDRWEVTKNNLAAYAERYYRKQGLQWTPETDHEFRIILNYVRNEIVASALECASRIVVPDRDSEV